MKSYLEGKSEELIMKIFFFYWKEKNYRNYFGIRENIFDVIFLSNRVIVIPKIFKHHVNKRKY